MLPGHLCRLPWPKWVGKGIIDPSAVNDVVIISALGGAIIWNFITLQMGLPSRFFARLDWWNGGLRVSFMAVWVSYR